MIVGTAGHIDHGKTALVKALTGFQGDRLKEEKARGITIDLGFAYLPIENGPILGFVDVPGHERFVHTMAAGASGIDCALVVVAADDGIMPQTLEHIAILDLLGVRRGLVALTKADIAAADRLADVCRAIRGAIADTMLEGAEILPVSALTGYGIAALRERLIVSAVEPTDRSADSRFRLAIDRVFTLSGVGLVVTGSVLSGAVHTGDHVLISPSGLPARVRSVHAQNRLADVGRAGERCALNLTGPGVAKESIRRGDTVLDPELHAPTDRIDASLRLLRTEQKQLGQWVPVRLHHASMEVGARIVQLGTEPLEPGRTGFVQLVLDRPIAASALDRFVIRDASARRTMGGGSFVDLRASLRRRRSPELQARRAALAETRNGAAFSALLATTPFAFDLAGFARDRALTLAQTAALVQELALVVLEAGALRMAIAPERWRLFLAALEECLKTFHAENPDRQGLGREQLRLSLQPRLTAPAFAAALHRAAQTRGFVLDGSFVRLSGHEARFSPKDEAEWAVIALLLGGEARFRPPRVRDIAEARGTLEREVRRILKLSSRMGYVDEVAHDHFFLRPVVHEMVTILAELSTSQSGTFTAADFRDRLSNGRKVAIQILEFFDRHGVTLRSGDLRRVNRHRLDLFGAFVHPSDGRNGGESSLVGRSDFKSEWGSQSVSGGFDSRSPPPARLRREP
jgi:selenocysteine-specific elongation factor